MAEKLPIQRKPQINLIFSDLNSSVVILKTMLIAVIFKTHKMRKKNQRMNNNVMIVGQKSTII